MLHLQVSSPIFHSDSITHSTTRHEVLKAFSVRKRQAESGLRADGRITLSTRCLVMLQAAHCSPVGKCDKLRKTPYKHGVNPSETIKTHICNPS
jgi:hypothetical protein